MDEKNYEEKNRMIDLAVSGDKEALEKLLKEVQPLIFNLSLRMLGSIPDAEDASQEVLIKVLTNLASFRKESAFSTWVFRIASNHLKSYQKGMFAAHPLSFDYYGSDIDSGKEREISDLTGGADRRLLEQELKLSCTNVMLQCFDPEERCIFILGTMFKIDSRTGGEIFSITSEAYRQRLSRLRRRMADFLDQYCGHSGKGMCSCARRVDYAISTHRLNPGCLEYSALKPWEEALLHQFCETMEEIDDLALLYSGMPLYRSTEKSDQFLEELLHSGHFSFIRSASSGN